MKQVISSRSTSKNTASQDVEKGLFGYPSPNKSRQPQRKLNRIRRQRSYRAYAYSVLALFGVAAILAILTGYHQTVINSLNDQLLFLTQKSGLALRDLVIEGRKNTSQERILNSIALKKGESIFAHAPEDIRTSLEKIDWVKNAVIVRQLPDQLFIKIQERKPIALWHYQKVTYLVDREGVAIKPDKLDNFKGLPVIVGEDAPISASKILAILEKFPELKKNIVSLVRVRKRRWDLVVYKNVIVKLPEDNNNDQTLERALARLSLLIEQKKIRLDDMQYIDVRLPNRIILKANTDMAVEKIKSANKGSDM